MSRSYAQTTNVSVDRSSGEIQKMLRSFGAESVMVATRSMKGDLVECTIAFSKERVPVRYRFVTSNDEREERRLWRCAVLLIKSKLVLIDEGISPFAAEFLAWVALPGGQVAGDHLIPQVVAAASGGHFPPLLPGGEDRP